MVSLETLCPSFPPSQAAQPAGKVTAKVEEERKDESPASWRLGLRKTGSYGALAEITATKEAQREKDTSGVMRSASSPRLSSSLDNKDKEKVNIYFPSTTSRLHESVCAALSNNGACPSSGKRQRDQARLRGPHHPQETGQYFRHR